MHRGFKHILMILVVTVLFMASADRAAGRGGATRDRVRHARDRRDGAARVASFWAVRKRLFFSLFKLVRAVCGIARARWEAWAAATRVGAGVAGFVLLETRGVKFKRTLLNPRRS